MSVQQYRDPLRIALLPQARRARLHHLRRPRGEGALTKVFNNTVITREVSWHGQGN